MKVVIIKYSAGNIHSVYLTLRRLGVEANLSDDWGTIQKADKIIFPGVGESSSAMAYLNKTSLARQLPTLKQNSRRYKS